MDSMRKEKMKKNNGILNNCDKNAGFTLAELMVVVVILAVAALITIPMMSSAADIQLKAALNILSADIEYTKNMAISRQTKYSIVFDISAESYSIKDANDSIISHPVNPGDFTVVFKDSDKLAMVDIKTVDIDSDYKLSFDYLGSPYNSSSNAMNSGEIVLEASGISSTINIEPVTGYVKIQ